MIRQTACGSLKIPIVQIVISYICVSQISLKRRLSRSLPVKDSTDLRLIIIVTYRNARSNIRIIQVIDAADMFPGNDQQVNRRFGMNIPENYQVFIFIKKFGIVNLI